MGQDLIRDLRPLRLLDAVRVFRETRFPPESRVTMTNHQAIELLAQVFPTLSPGALEHLRAAARCATHAPQVTLCHEGEIEHCFYIIIEGTVDVCKCLEGQRLLINQLGKGAHFGDLSMLLDVPRTATIITAEATTVFEIDRAVFRQFLQTNPEIVVALSQMLLQRFLLQEEKHLMEIARLKKRDTPPPTVFLSYARADGAFATRLANNLLKHNIDVWLDVYRIEPARSWARQIGDALDLCQTMIVVLSPTSVASENVEDEWNYYLDHKKPTIVTLHEPCKIPYRLSKLQYIDFHNTCYDQALARVIATLNTLP
jgi:CRP-like cAMP-binding protein